MSFDFPPDFDPRPASAPSPNISPDRATVLEHALKLPPDARQVALWILDQMAESFLLCAFATAVDELDHAALDAYPYSPWKHGRSYDAALAAARRAGKVPAGLKEECVNKAATLYLAIMQAPGGYDPAPAVLRWLADGHLPSKHWRDAYSTSTARVVQQYPSGTGAGLRMDVPRHEQAAARCWGHYAVMEAVGHGVSWSDSNAPLTDDRPRYEVRAPDAANVTWRVWDRVLEETHLDDCLTLEEATVHADTLNAGQDPEPLPSVGDLPGVSADEPLWLDECTPAEPPAPSEAVRAYHARAGEDAARIDEARDDERRAAHERRQRARRDEEG